MRASIAIISTLAATVAAKTAYTTVDVTITSCAPEGEKHLNMKWKKNQLGTNNPTASSCPGKEPTAPAEHETVYSTVEATITFCPSDGKEAHPMKTTSSR